MCTSCLLAVCIYALCPPTPQSTAHHPQHPHPGGLLEGLLGGLHCCSTCLKEKKQQGAVRAELFHEGEHLGAEGESGTFQTLIDGSLCHRGLSQEAEPWTRWGYEAAPGSSPDHQEILAETGLETELQPRSKIQPGDRHKARTACTGPSRAVGPWWVSSRSLRLIGVIRASKAVADWSPGPLAALTEGW